MMKENPPYSLPEVRLLLSEYLDGALDADKLVEIELLLEQYPAYKQELLKMQATRDALRSIADRDLQFSKASDAVWQKLAKQLDADRHAEPVSCDPEFISAYYDGEIPSSDPAFSSFEAQLSQNAEANRLLADISEVSEAVRQFGYRMENNCTIDVTQQVMQAFRAELGIVEIDEAVDPKAETISAYYDQELTAREIIEANRLIENDADARKMLGQFDQLSEQIRSISSQIEQQAPDCWPAVREQLEKQPDDGVVVPIDRNKQQKRMLRIALPAAAAAVLVLLTLPLNEISQPVTANDLAYKTNRSELASVPMPAGSDRRMRMSADEAMFQDAAYAPAPAAEADPSGQMAIRPDLPEETSQQKHAGKKTPSSEEYLFEALSEQMPEEDIKAILGQ